MTKLQKTAINKLCTSGIAELKKTKTPEQLEEVRVLYLGRQGKLANSIGLLAHCTLEEKRTFGPLLNEVKQLLQKAYETQKELLAKPLPNTSLFDVTAYKPGQLRGSLHIYTHIIEELSHMFISMGYAVADGPEVETEYYNFTSLNIPADHPARDSHDTFWLSIPDTLLRTHTSSIQAHTIETKKPPFAIFAPGRAYRSEATDATHDFMFTQGELLFIDKHVSLTHLIATAQLFLKTFFKKDDLKIRVRPGYFPFVEPGLEIDAQCAFCINGCSVCKKTGWIELLGAGLVHPHVLAYGGIDSDIYQGFAVGFGIERLAMIKYGITDIRLFHSSNLSFLGQY